MREIPIAEFRNNQYLQTQNAFYFTSTPTLRQRKISRWRLSEAIFWPSIWLRGPNSRMDQWIV